MQRSDPEVKYAWCFPQEGREGRGEGKEVTGQCAGSSAPQEDFWVYAECGGSHGGFLSRGGMCPDSGGPRIPWATVRGTECRGQESGHQGGDDGARPEWGLMRRSERILGLVEVRAVGPADKPVYGGAGVGGCPYSCLSQACSKHLKAFSYITSVLSHPAQ